MRLLLIPALTLFAATAHGQTSGTCTGSMTGAVGIGVYRSGSIVSVNATSLGNIFGEAECLCDDPETEQNDLQLEILLTSLLPADANGSSLELWVGNGCDSYTTRSNPDLTSCQKLTTTLQAQQFITGVASTNVIIRTSLSASALSAPMVNGCTGATQSRSIYLFIFKDPMAPLATCTLNSNINNTGPASAQTVTAETGDEAVSIKWAPPAATELQPLYYQILCATSTGEVVPGKVSDDQSYSTCLSNGDFRQRNNLPVGGSSVTVSDLGSSTTLDMSTGTTHFEPKAGEDDLGQAPPPDPDLAEPEPDLAEAVDMGDPDLLPPATGYRGVTTKSLDVPFTNLDPAYICGAPISATSTSYTQRIDKLVNGTAYQFVVLAVDSYGNATPSAVLTATPEPVEDFYRRYVGEGGTAHGFCVASGELGSAEIFPLVLIGLLGALYHRRKIKQWWERA